MARKVTCPHCKAQTYDTPTCGRCGGVLPRVKDQLTPEQEQEQKVQGELVYKIGMLKRAQDIKKQMKKIVLAKFKAIQIADGLAISDGKVVVERERRQYVYTSHHPRPVLLRPGQYSLAKVMVAGGGRSDDVGCLTIEVSEVPIPVTFVFPDLQSFDDNLIGSDDDGVILRGIQGALNSLSLRTADDRLGGALLQVRLHCTDPIKLVRCHDAIAVEPKDPMEQTGFSKREYREPRKNIFLRAWDWFCGQEPPPRTLIKETFETNKQVTLADLYPMIRYELAEAIGNSIRRLKVEALYDKQDSTRPLVSADIKQYMEKTLESFGLQITDVVAFQFRSPEYEEFLQRRGDASLAKQNLENEESEAQVRLARRNLGHEEFRHVEELEEQKDLLALDRNARLKANEDQIAAAEAARADQLASQRSK